MKTRVNTGMSRAEYKAFALKANKALTAKEIVGLEQTIAHLIKIGKDTGKYVKALDKAKISAASIEEQLKLFTPSAEG